MAILMIKDKETNEYKDFSAFIANSGYSFSKSHLVSESRDINGNLSVDILNEKRKITCQFVPMKKDDLQELIRAIEPYVVEIKYLDPGTDSEQTMTAYVGETEFNYYWILEQGDKLINGFGLSFVEC